MKCFYHAERDSVAQCAVCGKNLCTLCVVEKGDQKYCKECIKKIKYPVKIQKIAISSVICGVVAGILSALPGTSMLNCIFCLWIVVFGGLAVFIVKKIDSIKGMIKVEMAALTGGLTGLAASLVMWGVLQIGEFGLISRLFLHFNLLLFFPFDSLLILNVAVRSGLFALFGALGGIISNELIK